MNNPLYAKSLSDILKYLKADELNVYGTPDGIHGVLQYNKTSAIIKDGKKSTPYKDKSKWIESISKRCKGFMSLIH